MCFCRNKPFWTWGYLVKAKWGQSIEVEPSSVTAGSGTQNGKNMYIYISYMVLGPLIRKPSFSHQGPGWALLGWSLPFPKNQHTQRKSRGTPKAPDFGKWCTGGRHLTDPEPTKAQVPKASAPSLEWCQWQGVTNQGTLQSTGNRILGKNIGIW